MKTLGGIITIALLSLLMLNGLVLIMNKAAVNTDLDEESLQVISQYDAQFGTFYNNFSNQYTSAENLTSFEPDGNSIGDEAKEFFTTKTKVDEIRDTANLAKNLPDILFMSLPFVDSEDIAIYKKVFYFLLAIIIFVAIIIAIFGKFWESD